MTRKIVTCQEYPPIPSSAFDWCAHYEGEEEAGHYGWGATEAAAIQDFKDNCQAHHDERLGDGEPGEVLGVFEIDANSGDPTIKAIFEYAMFGRKP